jgi:hypothetical protein
MPTDLDLMKRHVEALFTHKKNGRLCNVNVPGGDEAPRFFLGRTPDGNIRRFRFDVPDALVEQIDAECLDEPTAKQVARMPVYSDAYLRLLETDCPVQNISTGPAYVFPDDVSRPSVEAIRVTAENVDVLNGGLDEWAEDVRNGSLVFVILHEGRAVSICCSVRVTPEAHEAGVETLPGYRGRGYAADVVTQWANEVQALGCSALYSTSWENTASQSVAAKLGLHHFGVDFHVR